MKIFDKSKHFSDALPSSFEHTDITQQQETKYTFLHAMIQNTYTKLTDGITKYLVPKQVMIKSPHTKNIFFKQTADEQADCVQR